MRARARSKSREIFFIGVLDREKAFPVEKFGMIRKYNQNLDPYLKIHRRRTLRTKNYCERIVNVLKNRNYITNYIFCACGMLRKLGGLFSGTILE